MSEKTRIGVCPFGCNSDTPDQEVEFSWSEQEVIENGKLNNAAFYATCACCHITFSTQWLRDELDISEIPFLLDKFKRALKINR